MAPIFLNYKCDHVITYYESMRQILFDSLVHKHLYTCTTTLDGGVIRLMCVGL